MIAGAILIAGHWEVVRTSGELQGMVRLNRWTGSLEVCAVDMSTAKPGATTLVGAQLVCH